MTTEVTQLFTFGFGQAFANCFVSITAPTAEECRQVMFSAFGKNWSMQYDDAKADDLKGHGMREIARIAAENGEMATTFLEHNIKGGYHELP